jgi:hypothetical protein
LARAGWLAAIALVAVPLLAGCGTGFQAETNQIYQPGPGITDRNGDVYLLNALIVTDGKGHGTVVGALVNQQSRTDTLTDAGVKCGPKTLDTSILSGTVSLMSQQSVQLATTGDVRVSGTLDSGTYCTLTLTFAQAGPIDLEIPIVDAAGDFSGVPVGAVAPPSTPSHSNPTG